MTIHLLGGFRVSRGERTIGESSWRLKKARSIVKLLAVADRHQLPRDVLMDLLWPDLNPKAAANNFHRAVHYARRALFEIGEDNDSFLGLHDQVLTLAQRGTVVIDVDAFEAAAATALRSNAPAHYQTAIDLYQGDFLPEDQYEDWATDHRNALKDTHLTLLLNLAQMNEQRGQIAIAKSLLQQVLEHEPAHEDAHAGLMRLYARAGQRYQALRQYDQLVETLQHELDAQPSAASQRLFRDVVEERFSEDITQPVRQLEEALPHTEPVQTNLPSHVTNFIGRGAECATVRDLVAAHRLVTITGPGGSGKTRLALEVATGLTGSFSDGVWLVELAHLSDSRLITQTVLATLGVHEAREQMMVATLQQHLASRNTLLVLDNCEHLIEESADLAHRLLHACPGLHILTTSRETLRVGGETIWSIPPLATPDKGRHLPLAELLESEAVQLFLDRVQERYPTFIVNRNQIESVVLICHHLEGIPLAIELAAGRARTLSLEQMVVRLDDALHLLSRGLRTGPKRQQSLESTIDWSHRLLPDTERRVFRRLAVFAGGCTLNAAEAVCTDDSSERSILNVLDHLVDKSLVTIDAQQGEPRYRLLEPIRQFAGDRLREAGEAGEIRRRHLAWCLAVTSQSDSKLWTGDQTAWIKRLAVEQDNVRAALTWCMEHDVGAGLTLAGNLWWFWRMRGDFWEGRRWLECILERTSRRTAIEAKALLADGTLAAIQGDFAWARPRIEESLAIFRAVGDTRFVGWATANLGYLDLHSHRLDSAEPLLQEGLDLLQQAGDHRGIGWTLAALGDAAAGRNDLDLAAGFFEQRLAVHRELEDERGISWALLGIANIARIEGDTARAKTLLEESLIHSYEVGDKWATAWALNCRGVCALSDRDNHRARTLLHESLEIFTAVGDRHGCIYSLFCAGLLLLRQGDHTAGARALLFAETLLPPPLAVWLTPGQRTDNDAAIANARISIGDTHFAQLKREARSMSFNRAINEVLESISPASKIT